MIDSVQRRDHRNDPDDAEVTERRLRDAEEPYRRESDLRPLQKATSLDALVAERRPLWYAPRPESPRAKRFRRRINAALIVIPLACLAALGVYESGLHVMVIWPDGGRPRLHYFWMSNGQEVPSPVARIAEWVGTKSP